MKLTEAIKINKDLLTQPYCHPEPDQQKAIQLGIEALKFTLAVRGIILSYTNLPLPGETNDTIKLRMESPREYLSNKKGGTK